MTDDSWQGLETWERVKWARSQRFETATAAAAALGMLQGTYRCYERGPDASKSMRLDYHHARRFAREFKVRWEWLLEGLRRALADAAWRAGCRREGRGGATACGTGASTAASPWLSWRGRPDWDHRRSRRWSLGEADLSDRLLYQLADALARHRAGFTTWTRTTARPSCWMRLGLCPKSGAPRRWRS